MNSALFLAGAVAFAGLAYLFAKNLLRARATAEIYMRGVLVRRAHSRVLFWVTVAFYTLATAFALAGVGACGFAVVFL